MSPNKRSTPFSLYLVHDEEGRNIISACLLAWEVLGCRSRVIIVWEESTRVQHRHFGSSAVKAQPPRRGALASPPLPPSARG